MQEVAQAEGLDVPALVRETMTARLRQYDPSRTLTETELLTRINRGFSENFWNRYRQLVAKRRAETMNEEEQQEAIAMSDQLEARNAERLHYLTSLASLRNTTVDKLMQEMGLHPASIE